MEKTGNVSFSDGQTTANLEIRVRGDTQPELDEIVSIHLLQVLKVGGLLNIEVVEILIIFKYMTFMRYCLTKTLRS